LDGPVLTAKVAQAVLRPAFPSVVIDRVLPRTGGENSAVYEVHTREPATRMIIKLYSEELHWKLRKEVYVYGLLGEGLPLPRVLHVDESRGIVDRSAIVLSLLAGAPLSTVGDQLDEGDVSRIYRRLGEVLASIHRIAQPGFGYIGTELLDPLPTNAEYMAARFAHKLAEFANLGGDPAIHEAVSRYVAAHAGMFADCRGAVLCHNDFHEGNVLVDRGERGWEVTGIVDMRTRSRRTRCWIWRRPSTTPFVATRPSWRDSGMGTARCRRGIRQRLGCTGSTTRWSCGTGSRASGNGNTWPDWRMTCPRLRHRSL
jgi:aminoglycoside phosphotransferase (APT) family kinase protein